MSRRSATSLVPFVALLCAAPALAAAPVNAPLANPAPSSGAPATTATPIRLHPDNPHLFLFRGKPTVLVGSTEHYGAVINLDFDVRSYLDELADKGTNLARLFSGSYVELPGAFDIAKNTLAPAPGRFLAPWARSDKPGYANGGNKFDLDRWDPAYFTRLRGFVAEAGRRGIVVELSLFSSLYGPAGWKASPMNAANNVNGVGAIDRKKVHTLENGNLLAYQEKLARKLVAELREADNVFFEIQNEPWADHPAYDSLAAGASDASLAWQRRIAAAIAAEEAALPNKHLVAQNVSNRSRRVTAPDANVSIFNFHYCRPPDAIEQNAQLGRAIGYDETGFDGSADATYRRQGWQFLLAGGALYDHLDYSFSIDRENGTDSYPAPGGGSPALRAQLGHLLRFVNGFGDVLPRMRPDGRFVRAGATPGLRALAAPGEAWAVYLAGAKTKALELELPVGAFVAEWVDPVTGTTVKSERFVHGGGAASVAVPAFDEDVALRLRRTHTAVVSDDLEKTKAGWIVTSPDGKSRMVVVQADLGDLNGYPPGRRLYYQVEHGPAGARVPVVTWSPLGIVRADERFVDDLTFRSTSTRPLSDSYTLLAGKARQIHARGNERTLAFTTTSGSKLNLVLRAYDDGVAFRYEFPDKRDGLFTVTGEETGFRVPDGARASMMVHDDANHYKPAYEQFWEGDLPAGTSSTTDAGWSLPALFRANGKWTLITEGGLDGQYAGTRLAKDAPGGLYRIRFPDGLEGEGYGDVAPRSTLPWATPWRIVIAGDSAAAVVESHAVTHLATPSKVKDTRWIKPGRSGWSWWAESDSPKSYDAMVPYIDAAAQLGWEYFLVDANWDLMKGGGTWKDLAAYAAKKKVRLLLWYNSGGQNNFVSERPRDRMFDRDKRRAEMKQIADAGIAGIKVDFFQSDKQVTIQEYLDILADAADAKLLVNFHGCTIPRGWERTWPNLMGHEAVKGGEQYKFSAEFAKRAPAHNAVLPFTRNAIGPADYTPVTFTDSTHPHVTTNAHELALSVVLWNGLQHFADSYKAYLALPEAPLAFVKAVPAVWDETRFVAGEPGKLAVIARRAGREWFVGGINGEPEGKTVEVPLAFLGKGGKHAITIITDGNDDRAFASTSETHAPGETLAVRVRGNGGFVLRATPAK